MTFLPVTAGRPYVMSPTAATIAQTGYGGIRGRQRAALPLFNHCQRCQCAQWQYIEARIEACGPSSRSTPSFAILQCVEFATSFSRHFWEAPPSNSPVPSALILVSCVEPSPRRHTYFSPVRCSTVSSSPTSPLAAQRASSSFPSSVRVC